MSNDVVMVAIPKELRDRIVCLMVDANWDLSDANVVKDLRAAPETVSLEGVERHVVGYKGGASIPGSLGEWVKFSDLRRLVTPVQPSAVVSRDAIVAELEKIEEFRLSRDREGIVQPKSVYNEIADAIFALRPPHLVAPIQPSSVVSREAFEKWAEARQYDLIPAEQGEAYESDETEGAWIIWQAAFQPQPVAPVHSGGSDLIYIGPTVCCAGECAKKAKKQVKK